MAKKTMVNVVQLEKLMKAKGWDWRELAKQSGLSYETLWSMKSGRRPNTSSATIKKLARALGATAFELLQEMDAESLPNAIRELTEVAIRLSEAKQEELLRIAAALEKLEREQVDHPLPSGVMEVLLDATEVMKNSPGNEDLLARLIALLESGK